MIFRGKRIVLAAGMLSLSGCVLLSGAGDYSLGGGNAPLAADDAGAQDAPANTVQDASSDLQTVSPEVDAAEPLPPPTRPNEGTYTYAVTGSEELKGIFPYKATYSAAKVKIEHEGTDCFKQTITLRDGYDEVMHECVVGLDIVQDAGTRTQKFPLIGGASTTLTCAPGDVYFGTNRAAGLPLAHTCDGQNSDDKSGASGFTTAGSYTFVGEDTVVANSVGIPVLHYHDDRKVTGKQTGTNVADWYYAADGTLVRLVRNITISYPSIIGTVTYIESATLTLSGLPQSK